MKNKILNRKISLIILDFVILIGLISSFTITTFAWFTNNNRAQIVASQIEIAAHGFQIHSYNVYPVMVFNEGSTTNSYTFENSPVVRMLAAHITICSTIQIIMVMFITSLILQLFILIIP